MPLMMYDKKTPKVSQGRCISWILVFSVVQIIQSVIEEGHLRIS